MNYDDINDYETLSLVAENEEASEILFNKYKPLIIGLSKKIYYSKDIKGIDLNDFIQEGMIALNEAINTFDEENSLPFFTYAKICVERKLISILKSNYTLKNSLLNNSKYIESFAKETFNIDQIFKDDSSNPEYIFIENEDEINLLNKIKSKLTDFETLVFELKISGFDYKEIGQLLGKDDKSVSNALSRIKLKCKKYMSNN